MDKIPRLTAEQRSDLVAYLDGELAGAAVQEIEQTLAESPVARHEVEMLTRTWELLDTLPRAAASQEFIANTLTSIQALDHRTPLSEQQWYQRARRGVVVAGWVAGLAMASAVGFLITSRWIPDKSAALIRDFPVIRELDTYTEIDNVEFLRELQESGLFDETTSDHDN